MNVTHYECMLVMLVNKKTQWLDSPLEEFRNNLKETWDKWNWWRIKDKNTTNPFFKFF